MTQKENAGEILASLSLDEIDEVLDAKPVRGGYGPAKDAAILAVLKHGKTYAEAAAECIHPTTGKAAVTNTVKMWVRDFRDQVAKANKKPTKYDK